MNCNELQILQQNFATLIRATAHQDLMERSAKSAKVEGLDLTALMTAREFLEKQKDAVGAKLAAHIAEHGCAN